VITMTESQQQSSAAPPVEPTTPPTATPLTATPLTATPLTQVQTDAAIGDLRVEIDAVDAALVDLVARRIQISKQVGRLRMAAGGTRLSLSREQAVVARFSAELGETGTSLAMLLLRAGRGRL
jgi:chorismate mutase